VDRNGRIFTTNASQRAVLISTAGTQALPMADASDVYDAVATSDGGLVLLGTIGTEPGPVTWFCR
jgi:hypothetical protein